MPSDLVVTRIRRPSMIGRNRPFGLMITIKNQGVGDADASEVKVCISGDKIIDDNDECFTGSIPALASMASYDKYMSLVAKNVVTHRGYYILVEIDAGDTVNETDEGNNISFTTTYCY